MTTLQKANPVLDRGMKVLHGFQHLDSPPLKKFELRFSKSCLELGMDCLTLVFYHCDPGPTNVIVDQSDDCLGID